MSKFNIAKHGNGKVTIEIQALIPERFINLLWKNNILIKNIRKKSITTMVMEIELKDYPYIETVSRKTNTKVKIIKRKGMSFLILKMKNRVALVGGAIFFIGILYYLSTFIWGIDIETEKHISPYEVRQKLKSIGIKPGINKKDLNVYTVEEKMIRANEELSWVFVRVEGARLKVKVAERQAPPSLKENQLPCNLISQREGQIVRVYTTAGTSVVNIGDVIKAGQLLVKGEQGKEGSIYPVAAKGSVIARTFYEGIKEISIVEKKKEKTGKKIENYYIDIKGRKIYFRNSLNKFEVYDKIIENTFFIKKEIVYEMKEKEIYMEPQKVIDETVRELYSNITIKMDKNVKVIDKIVEAKPIEENKYRVRIVVVAEENVAVQEKVN